MPQPHSHIRTFDPGDEYVVIERPDLPHWTQAGTLCFITWRTWDSMPRNVLQRWAAERDCWLLQHGIDPSMSDWRTMIAALPEPRQNEFRAFVSDRFEGCLDECHGACVLRRPDLAQIVANSMLHFDRNRYEMLDFVVMPNHVHLLAAFVSAETMLQQCESWKHYTATKINRALGRRGRFWEVDGFDHLVRSEEQFHHLRKYIADNPDRARLRVGEFIHYSRHRTE